MVVKNRSSTWVLQKKAGKSSSSEGATATTKNLVVLGTDPSGRGSSGNPFLAKREG